MNFPKHSPILLIHTYILFCLNTNYSNAKSATETWKVFSDDNAIEFNHLAVNEYGRWVYIGAINHIYQLSTDLKLLIKYTISELSPSDCTAPNCSHSKLKRNTTTFNENEVLVLDYQNQQLISCGTFFKGICHAHEISNISKIWTTRFEPIAESSSVHRTVAFIAPSLSNNSSTLYLGISPIRNYTFLHTITITNQEREYSSSVLTQNTASYFTRNECPVEAYVRIIYGFSSENVGYFIAADGDPNTPAGGYLMVTDTLKNSSCKRVPIICTSGSDKTPTGAILNAYIQKQIQHSASKTDSHEMEEKIMFTLQENNHEDRGSFSVCTYQINKLHSVFQKNETLVGNLVYSHPPTHVRVTAMVVTSINNYTILFLGTNDGRLQKISIKGVDSPDLSTGNTYADITIDARTEIHSDMLFDSTMNFLYVMTKKKLTKVKIHICDEYNTSHSCLVIKDPYCGWCFPSNRCCSKSECNVEENPIDWVSYDIDKYIDVSSSPSANISRTADSNVTFKLITPHPFINHTIICSFEFANFSINTTTICNENSINCSTPTPNDVPPTPTNNHSTGAQLSVQTNHFPVFQKILIQFFDCTTYKSCISCITSAYPCQWYVNEGRCTENAIWKEDDIVIGMNLSSTNLSLWNSTIAYDGFKYPKNSTFCPQFFTKYKSDIYIPTDAEKKKQIKVRVKVPVELRVKGLICQIIVSDVIRFAVDSQDVFSNNVQLHLKEIEIACDYVMFEYLELKPFTTVELSVLWNGSIPLDNTYNSHIVLYKCVHMGDQCTACVNTNFSCMWNSKTRECKYYSSDDESTMTDPWLNDIQKCSNSTIFKKSHRNNQSTNWLTLLTENIYLIITITLTVGVTSIVVPIFVICRRYVVRSRQMQKQINIMGMEMIAMSQCVKRVMIENKIELDENESHILRLPNVNIVYEPFSTLSENKTEPKNEYELLLDETWEIPRENLVLGKFLGKGEFGRVVVGNVSGPLHHDIVTTVAVKMLKKKHTDIDMVNLVKEMELMKLIGKHDNVLALLGCCTQDGPLFIITEYSPHGNLLDFLRKHNRDFSIAQEPTSIDLSEKVLIMFAQQVAKGMEYLASIKCIHRDLAARNVLVFDNYIVKIADFGLARDIRHEYYYRQKTNGRFPVKWMAPEALKQRRCTTQSDVWSYGILVWEIMTFGDVPYFAYDDAEKLIKDIRAGYRMNKPDDCPEILYCLMRKCWNYLPKDRPDFTTIIQELNAILPADNVGTEQSDPHCSKIATESDHEESETESLLQNRC